MGAEGWSLNVGYIKVARSYVHLHENLLDLSHLTYLHANSFGMPEYALAPIETRITDTEIEVWRSVECILPPLYAVPLGWEGERALRRSLSRFVSPALHINVATLKNLERPDDDGPLPVMQVAQLLTAESGKRPIITSLFVEIFASTTPTSASIC